MSDSRKKMPTVSIGSSLLLVIFLILCLVMFATLSVTTARSNYLQSQREADRLTDKTTANNASEEILSQISTLLSDTKSANTKAVTDHAEADTAVSGTTDAVFSAMTTAQTSAGAVSVSIFTLANGHTQLSWQIPFNDSQALAVTVDLADSQLPSEYTITQWQTLQTDEWSSTDTIKVMTP